MIHAVEKSKNASKALGRTIDYVMGEKDHNGDIRDDVVLLKGDPEMLLAFNKGLAHRKGKTFLHSSLSFTEDETKKLDAEPKRLEHILTSYQKQLAAGLPTPGRLPVMMVQHRDGKSMHVHIISLRADTLTMKDYQPFVKQRGDIKRFNGWKTIMMATHKLDNPYSLDHRHGITINPRDPAAKIKTQISDHLNNMISEGHITNRENIINVLNDMDKISVSRISPNFLSIEVEGRKSAIRLKGAFCNESFTDIKAIEEEARDLTSKELQEVRTRLQQADDKLAATYRKAFDVTRMENIRGDSIGANNTVLHNSSDGKNIQLNNSFTPSFKASPRIKKKVLDKSDTETKLKQNKIFNGASFTDKGIFWKGSYGQAQIYYDKEGGLTLGKGSTMEWRMAAQYAKEQGWTSAIIKAVTVEQARRSVLEFQKVGITNITITIGGQDVTESIKRNIIQGQAERAAITQSVREGATGLQHGETELHRAVEGLNKSIQSGTETARRYGEQLHKSSDNFEQHRIRLEETLSSKVSLYNKWNNAVDEVVTLSDWYSKNGQQETALLFYDKAQVFKQAKPNQAVLDKLTTAINTTKQSIAKEIQQKKIEMEQKKIEIEQKKIELENSPEHRLKDIQRRVEEAGSEMKAVLNGKISQEELAMLNEVNGVNEHMQRGSYAIQDLTLGMHV